MRVLLLGNGKSVHVERQIRALLDAGCEVVFSGPPLSEPIHDPRFRYVGHLRRYEPRWAQSIPERVPHSKLWSGLLAARLRLLCRRIRPDVVHVHAVEDEAFYAARAGVQPLVLTAYGSDINQAFWPGVAEWRKSRVRTSLRRASAVVVDAGDIAQKCQQIAGQAVRCEIVPQGVDTARFRPGRDQDRAAWRERLAVGPHATVFVSMRAWGPFYRQDAILEGFAVARRGISAPAFLVFKVFNRGSSPAENQRYRLEIERRARELDVLDAIRWIDDVPEERMPELYSLADVIVNFPRADAFPVTFLEAGASCAPVVSCRLPAYRGTFAEQYFELVEDGDIDALGRAMAKTANEGPEARADRMSELRAVVRARYDTAVCTARLMDVYRCAARRPERLATGVEGGRVEG